MYSKVGFKYYSDPAAYDPSLNFATTHFPRKNIGINNYVLPLTIPGLTFLPTGADGPRVSCHPPSGDHKLQVAAGMVAGGICTKCHMGGFARTTTKIEEEMAGYNAALNVLQEALAFYGVSKGVVMPSSDISYSKLTNVSLKTKKTRIAVKLARHWLN